VVRRFGVDGAVIWVGGKWGFRGTWKGVGAPGRVRRMEKGRVEVSPGKDERGEGSREPRKRRGR